MGYISIVKKLFVLGNILSGIVALELFVAGFAGLFIFFKYYHEVLCRDISIALIVLGTIMLLVNVGGCLGASLNNRWLLLTYIACLGVAIAVEICLAGLSFGGVFNIKKHLETWTSTFSVRAGIFASVIKCCLESTCENNCVDVYGRPIGGVLTALLVLVELAGCFCSYFLWKVIGSKQQKMVLNKSNSIELN